MRIPRVLSLYTGAGGLDYGLEAAGFEVAAATDLDHDSCETLRRNRRWPVVEGNILDLETERLLFEKGEVQTGKIELLVGGPPCQPFSKSGYWARGDSLRLLDPRADTLGAYLRILESTLPEAFLLENVEGLGFRGKSEGLSFLLQAVADVNRRHGTRYAPYCKVLNAAEFGVPQVRRRLFIVASREGLPFRFPSDLAEFVPGAQKRYAADGTPFYRSAWDALADAAPDVSEDLSVRGKWSRLLPTIPEGQNYLWHTDRGGGLPLFGWRRRYWGFLLKLAKARPSWTIQAQPGPAIGPFHWENRRLSRRELARLQTFPEGIHFCGTQISVQRQIGNAVPSLLAEVLGREIKQQLLSEPSHTRSLTLLPPVRIPVPGPEPVQDVPPEYRAQAGYHSAHPGTGMGSGAMKRRQGLRQLALAGV